MVEDRRRWPRCQIPWPAYVRPAGGQPETGRLLDISAHGLAFEYIPGLALSAGLTEIGIGAPGLGWNRMEPIACRTAYDILVLGENRSFKGVEVRQQGVEFIDLSEEHKQALHLLIAAALDFKMKADCRSIT